MPTCGIGSVVIYVNIYVNWKIFIRGWKVSPWNFPLLANDHYMILPWRKDIFFCLKLTAFLLSGGWGFVNVSSLWGFSLRWANLLTWFCEYCCAGNVHIWKHFCLGFSWRVVITSFYSFILLWLNYRMVICIAPSQIRILCACVQLSWKINSVYLLMFNLGYLIYVEKLYTCDCGIKKNLWFCSFHCVWKLNNYGVLTT